MYVTKRGRNMYTYKKEKEREREIFLSIFPFH